MKWISEAPDPFASPSDRLPFGRRLKEPRGHRIPVIVVTGFLGAGKSTLVRRLIASPEGRDTAVVVNEIGDVGVDDAVLAESGETVRLIGAGCLCCTVRSDLELTLRRLHDERRAGRIPPFRRIVLETSGAADPTAILQTLVGNRSLADAFHLANVVTVVDAVHGSTTLAEAPEAHAQIAVADRLIVSKTDLAPMDVVADLEAEIDSANPDAPRIRTVAGIVDPAFLLAETPPRTRVAVAASTIHDKSRATISFATDRPFTMAALREALGTLTRLRGPDLLRLKGLVAVEEARGPVVVHAVRHQVHPPVELDGWPDDDRRSRFVIVARDIPRDAVQRLFEAAADLSPPSIPELQK